MIAGVTRLARGRTGATAFTQREARSPPGASFVAGRTPGDEPVVSLPPGALRGPPAARRLTGRVDGRRHRERTRRLSVTEVSPFQFAGPGRRWLKAGGECGGSRSKRRTSPVGRREQFRRPVDDAGRPGVVDQGEVAVAPILGAGEKVVSRGRADAVER